MTSTNIEVKFIYDSAHQLDAVLKAYSFDDEEIISQNDIYLYGQSCFFKLRTNNGTPTKLLKYKRLTSPVLRESAFESVLLEGDAERSVAKYIFGNVIRAGVVRKQRRQFRSREFLLNVDEILAEDSSTKLYSVVEIEYFVRDANSKAAQRTIDNILRVVGVKPYQIMPYSNIHMVNMLNASRVYRQAYKSANRRGQLILIDGGSGTGKSTVKEILVTEGGFQYAKRDTTRAPRPDDFTSEDYNFVAQDEFARKALSGKYIEFRDFLFGMSYGLPWEEFAEPLCQGKKVMALINLGNGFFTKKLFPEATLVLLHADLQTIRARLNRRGDMTQEQIKERLENNRVAANYAEAYDAHIDTSRFGPRQVAEQIVRSIST
jgi:guanylate kinase/adenylate cyclase class IV